MKITNQFLYVYYGLIAIAIVATAFLEYKVPGLLSYLTVLLLFIPLFIRADYAPFVLTLFLLFGPQLNNTFFNPHTLQLVSILYPVFYAIIFHKHHLLNVNVLVLVILYFILAHIYFGDDGSFLYSIITVLFLGSLITNKNHVTQVSYAFVVISLICSIYCYISLKDYSIGYLETQIEENEFDHNPNRMGCTIGLGVIAAIMLLTNIIKGIKTKGQKILVVFGLLSSIIALGLLGSRGAFFSCTASSILLFFLSPKKLKFKTKWLLLLIFIITILYVLGIFDYIIFRMSDEKSADMSGRSEIWSMKLAYFNQLDSISKIFGIGKDACFKIGRISTHNDFITALIAYGYIGAILFIFAVLFPFLNAKKNKLIVAAFLVFIIGECCVLEPVFRGYYNILFYYLFVSSFSAVKK